MPAPIAEISPRNRIELPNELRKSLKWKTGQKLMIIRQKDGLFLCPLITPEQVFGMAEGANPEAYRDRNDRY